MPRKEKVTLPHSKSRIAGYRLKPEQVHQNKKNYNRRQVKKVIQELIKASPDKTD